MAKMTCSVCDDKMISETEGVTIKDGVICIICEALTDLTPKELAKLDIATIREIVDIETADYMPNEDGTMNFMPTKVIDKYLFIDEPNKQFRVGKDGEICDFSDLISFEFLEDGESIVKGGLGRAMVGGALFGGTGAILGGITGGKKSKGICTSMSIVITVKNTIPDTLYINFIGGGIFALKDVKKDSFLYRDAHNFAQQCLSALKIIADENEAVAPEAAVPEVDTAAELEKFHDLMTKGIITEDEFNAKKAQLLGL